MEENRKISHTGFPQIVCRCSALQVVEHNLPLNEHRFYIVTFFQKVWYGKRGRILGRRGGGDRLVTTLKNTAVVKCDQG